MNVSGNILFKKKEKGNLIDNIAILVVSCDKYSDLWNPFFETFFKFWPDCPFNIYLLSNYKTTNLARIKNVTIGRDISWSDNLIKCIKLLKENYIFLFLDDLFLVNFVKTKEVLYILNWAIDENVNYIRMNPSPVPDKKCNKLLGIISKGSIYRTSTVLSVWKKDVLSDLLKKVESAWDFEILGSLRSDKYNNFYATWEKYLPFMNGVIKGKWRRSSVKMLKSLGIEIDLNKREIMNLKETIGFYFYLRRSRIFEILVPPKYRRKFKKIILRGRYNYELKL